MSDEPKLSDLYHDLSKWAEGLFQGLCILGLIFLFFYFCTPVLLYLGD